MKREVDWMKLCLLCVVIVGTACAATDRLNLSLPSFVPTTRVIEIPEPDSKRKDAVRPLVAVRDTNPQAAEVVSQFLAACAFVVSNNDRLDVYDSSALMRTIENGLESIVVLQDEVGDIDIGAALNKSLQQLWRDETRQLSTDDAAKGLYACAWALAV